jgi:hypothetical protein
MLLPPYCPGTSKLYCVLSKSASHSEKVSSRGVALSALLLRASAHFCVSLCSSLSAFSVAFAFTGVVNHLAGKNFSNSRTCSEAYLRLYDPICVHAAYTQRQCIVCMHMHGSSVSALSVAHD